MVNKTFSWTCPKCGQAVPQNAVHSCAGIPLQFQAAQFTNLEELEQRIADLERRLASLERRVNEVKE